MPDKRILNFLIIVLLSIATFWWTFFIFHVTFDWKLVSTVVFFRILASVLIFEDYSLSWSKVTQKTFLIKTIVAFVPLLFYIPLFYGEVRIAVMLNEFFTYLVATNFLMYLYYYYTNQTGIAKTKSLVIYGAGKAGNKLESEYRGSEYRIKYFIDDDKVLQGRSIDGIKIVSKEHLIDIVSKERKYELLVIAATNASSQRIKEIHENLSPYFAQIKILPTTEKILVEQSYSKMLQDISIEDLLARRPKDLDKAVIQNFIKGKKVLITGAGGSIGSEISRQCALYGASQLLLLDHSEYNLYTIVEELQSYNPIHIMQSVVNRELLEHTFEKYKPDIVIHAAAYKHVPLVEENIAETIINNIVGTKNAIDCAIKHKVQKFVFISTDKAVRPTNVMGATKRICELYAQNVVSLENFASEKTTEIVAVRFGNVLGSSGSVIRKFKSQIESGGPLTVTHPEITRYFMLVPEACELVLQAASIGVGGEIFILDMGEPIKIVDLAKKMLMLSGREDIKIEFSGLRAGEKLYEELLINASDAKTEYESITVAGKTEYDISKLNQDIEELIKTENKLKKLKEIVPEFKHHLNSFEDKE